MITFIITSTLTQPGRTIVAAKAIVMMQDKWDQLPRYTKQEVQAKYRENLEVC